jgi:hypothetical protein
MVATPNKISATGYGSPSSYAHYTPAQQKLMAIRAAQVDAYRNLAERVYGFRVSGSTTVSAFATQSDKIRSHVDSFIRGAHVVNTAVIADGNVEVTVELDLTPQFFHCMTNWNSCLTASTAYHPPVQQYPVYSAPQCVAYGCVAPSMYYYNH